MEKFLSTWSVYIVASVVLGALVVLSIWVDDRLVENAQQNVGRELSAVLSSTEKGLDHWLESEEELLSFWGDNKEVVALVKDLKMNERDSRSLRSAPSQSRLVELLSPLLAERGISGLSIYSISGLVLFDSRPSEIAKSVSNSDVFLLIENSIQKEVGVQINLPRRGTGKDFAIMLATVPIREDDGQPFAVLAARIDPESDFTATLQRGRMGESGESYAFNADGKMISESRFDKDLMRLALVPKLGRSILTVDVRDPGGNLLEGFRPSVQREQQPLTLMAKSAIDGNAGQNLIGYNDYRGVPVIGAWTWNAEHGFGIATEIDVDEAYRSSEATRGLFRLLSLITGLLIVFLTLYFIRNRSATAKTREQLDAVFQNSPLGLILFSAEGVIKNCNSRFVELMGSSREKLIGFNTLKDASDPGVRKALQSALKGEWADYEGEYTSATGGKTKALRIIYNPVETENIPTEVIASLEDITDRRETEQKLEAVNDSAPDAIVISDSDGIVTGWNRAAERILGWSESEIKGRSLETFIPDRYKNSHRAGIVSVNKSGKGKMLGKPMELYGLHKDGREFPIELSLSTWNVGSERFFTGMIRDITERKKMEAELRDATDAAESANRAKSAFLANMSHELRTPMNAIIGYTEMLQEDAEDLEEEDDLFSPDLKKIHTAGKHLLSLINDVLDLSKIESGKMELYNEAFDLALLTKDIASTIHSLIEKNGNELKVKIDPAAGEMYADVTKIRQSLFNLLSNAAKFTNEGTITLSVDRSTEDNVDWISFAVSDTGIGVAQDKLDKLFEEFSQADESITRKYGGTGLGLAITKRFCEMMGGEIVVESELGEGTTFTIRLPTKAATKDSGADSTEENSSEITNRILSEYSGGVTILVIDDEETARELLQRSLEKDGYSVALASSGAQGLELARQIKPALITLDVMMPKMDGWAVLRALKEDDDLKDIPVIMVTIVSDKEMMFALGAVEHLTKPVDRTLLRTLVEKYAGTDSARRALIIDDDEPSRSMLRRTLEDLKWNVDEAENGAEGLEKLENFEPDLILLDLMMPVMDGFEFIDEVRKREHLRSIPIIVISAKDLTTNDRNRLHGAVEIILEKSEQTTEQLLRQIRETTLK